MQPTTNYTEQLLDLLEGAIAELGGVVPPVQRPANLDDRMLALLGALLGRLPAALGELQPLDSDLEAIALQGTTAYGRSLLQVADAAAARSAIAAVDNTHQNQIVGPSLHGLGSNVRVLGNRNASGEFIQRGSANASPAAVALSPTSLQYSDIPVTFAAAYASAPLVFCAAVAGAFANAVSPTTTGFTMRIFHTTPGSPFVSGNFIAIGA
jgi:hypothetical protein